MLTCIAGSEALQVGYPEFRRLETANQAAAECSRIHPMDLWSGGETKATALWCWKFATFQLDEVQFHGLTYDAIEREVHKVDPPEAL